MTLDSPLVLVVLSVVAATSLAFRVWVSLARRRARQRTDRLLRSLGDPT